MTTVHLWALGMSAAGVAVIIAIVAAEVMTRREIREYERTKDPMDPGMMVRW